MLKTTSVICFKCNETKKVFGICTEKKNTVAVIYMVLNAVSGGGY